VTTPTGKGDGQALVTEMLAPLVSEARDLRAVVAADGAARRKENQRLLALFLALAAMVLLLLVVVVQNRQRSSENSEILRKSAENSAQIKDCTTVGGKCYQEGARRTGAVLEELRRTNVYIAQCSRVTKTDAELEKCVDAKLAAEAATPPPD
jgi:hypothetical protein